MSNEKREAVKLQKALSYAGVLTRKIRGLPEDKEIYIRVYMHSGDDFYISGWASWPDLTTGGILVFFQCKDKCIVTEFRNVEKIEFLHKKPDKPGELGFVGPVKEFKWSTWEEIGEIGKDNNS